MNITRLSMDMITLFKKHKVDADSYNHVAEEGHHERQRSARGDLAVFGLTRLRLLDA